MTSTCHIRRSLSLAFLAVALSGWLASSASAINIVFDYRYDTSNFFGNTTARNALEAAAADLSSILNDTFTQIQTPNIYYSQYLDGQVIWSWSSQFYNPSGSGVITRYNDTIEADTYLIFAGAKSLGGMTLGQGSVGGWGYSVDPSGYFFQNEIDEINAITDDFISDVTTRGETSGFANWGGAITFDNDGSTTWTYDHTGPITPGTVDLYTVAVHELVHALGIGGADEWDALINNSNAAHPYFTGANATSVYGGNVPIEPFILGHWADGTMSTTYSGGVAQEALMSPTLSSSARQYLTLLDAAGLVDIGWEIDLNPQTPHPGDANGDGMVNLADLQILGDNWQSSTASWAQADFTGDGNVNLADLQILGDNWGFGVGSDISLDEALALVSIPEPTTALCLLISATLLTQRRRAV